MIPSKLHNIFHLLITHKHQHFLLCSHQHTWESTPYSLCHSTSFCCISLCAHRIVSYLFVIALFSYSMSNQISTNTWRISADHVLDIGSGFPDIPLRFSTTRNKRYWWCVPFPKSSRALCFLSVFVGNFNCTPLSPAADKKLW